MAENYYPIEFDAESSFTIINNGTAPSPCVVTFIPRVNFSRVVLTGLSKEPIVVSDVNQDQVLVIDGENRKVTLNDQDYFEGYNSWEFPKVQPGVNQVGINNGSLASLAIEYSTRYI